MTTRTEEPPHMRASTPEYRAGYNAFARDMKSPAHNPYGLGDGRRTRWFDGYIAAQIRQRLGEVFTRWGIEWP